MKQPAVRLIGISEANLWESVLICAICGQKNANSYIN